MLVHIKAKENDIHPIKILEDNDTFAAVFEFRGVIFEGIPFFHTRSDIKGATHRGYLSYVDFTSSVRCYFGCFFQWNILCLCLLLCQLRHFLLQLLPDMPLQLLTQFGPGQILCHGSTACRPQCPLLLPVVDGTAGTYEFRALISVLASIEEGANLVDPTFASITLHPRLLRHLIVFLLVQLALAQCNVSKLNGLALLQIFIARLTPVILIIPPYVEVGVSSNAL
mmetsp:Transcript_15099/g.25800  ORF Transcript_15099/g.25800 Transcript_15099/m.25800 type:complete len:225 (-) Transcript_15099:952-1626(-)